MTDETLTALRALIQTQRRYAHEWRYNPAAMPFTAERIEEFCDSLEALLSSPPPEAEPPVYGSDVLCAHCATVFCPHGERLHFDKDGCPQCSMDEPPEAEPPTCAVALRGILSALESEFEHFEECEDCLARDGACPFHGSQKLWAAWLAAEEALGPCVCGHSRSRHWDEEGSNCRECPCTAFKLPPNQPTEAPHA